MTETDETRLQTDEPAELPEQEALQTPDVQEEPEEGFVPFNQEVSAKKFGRKKKLLIVMAVIALLMGVLVFTKKYYCFYARTLHHLHFDYRNGEKADTDSKQKLGAAAAAAENAVSGKNLTLSANVYCFNNNRELSLIVSAYQYTHDADGASLKVRMGTSGGLLTQKNSFRADPNGQVWEFMDGSEHISADSEAGMLYDYFFTTKPHHSATMECKEAYQTTVGEQVYTCEIWLMSCEKGGETVYNTLYRYYSDDKLAAVRVLSSKNNLMMVYDITDYSAV